MNDIIPICEKINDLDDIEEILSEYNNDRELKKELMILLKELRDERDYIIGTVTVAGTKEVYCKLIEYISLMRCDGKAPNPDDVLALAISLRKRYDEARRKKVVAAML